MLLTAYRRPVVLTAMDWNEADHPRGNDGRFAVAASFRQAAGTNEITKSGLVKALAKQGIVFKSNEAFVTETVEAHNASIVRPTVMTGEERRAARKAEHEAGLTDEQRADRERIRAERDAEWEKQRQIEAKRNERALEHRSVVQNAPILAALPVDKAAHIAERAGAAQDADSLERVEDEARLAVVGAIAEHLQHDGWSLRHVSKEGSVETSRYLTSPDGTQEIRVSDHHIPQTARRESQGGSRWRELVVGSEWSSYLMDDYLDEVNALVA